MYIKIKGMWMDKPYNARVLYIMSQFTFDNNVLVKFSHNKIKVMVIFPATECKLPQLPTLIAAMVTL